MWFVFAIQLISVVFVFRPAAANHSCATANWKKSLDRQMWSVCPKTNTYLKGFWRRNKRRGGERVGRIQHGKCCEAGAPIYTTQPAICCNVKEWKSTLNQYNVWALCPKGYYVNGLRLGRGKPAFLSDIDEGQCCRPQNHPDSYEDCYDEDVSRSFNRRGWSECQRVGYYMTGFYKSNCNELNCIDTFRCCKMKKAAIDGGWSDFGDWSECSVTCGGGIQERRRTCTSPPPSNGGKSCVGNNMETQTCITKSCKNQTLSALTACPDGWVLHEHYCYLIIDTPTIHRDSARTKCQQFGADLAKITSATQNQFIFDLLRKQNTVTSYGVWLGLHRKADIKFYWADGTPLTGYRAWGYKEPSGVNEKCCNMLGPGPKEGKWNDLKCTYPIFPKLAPVILCQKTSYLPTIKRN